MQENKTQKIKCRCCGQQFQIRSSCPFCGFHVIVGLGDKSAQLEALAKQWGEKHAGQILKSVGVVYHQPAKWNGDVLVPGAKDYMKLAELSELTNEFRWNDSMEFASFGGGEEASLVVYMEYLDGSKEEKEVPINLPLVRGVTWKAAVRLAEDDNGVEFAVGIPERFTQTKAVNIRK